MTSDVIVIN